MIKGMLYLHLEPHMMNQESGATVEIKLENDRLVVDAWSGDDCIATTWKAYSELNVEVKDIEHE
mgnify:FL=1|jgi:hypothetical protein